MVRRIAGMMGLLAFAITIIGGVISANSFEFTIMRSIWAMLTFCGLGLVIGWCAERVVREYHRQEHDRIFGPPDSEAPPSDAELVAKEAS